MLALNVVGDNTLIKKATNVFIKNFVQKSNLKHIDEVNFIFKNFSDDRSNICSNLFKETDKVNLFLQDIVADNEDDKNSLGNQNANEIRSLMKKSKLPSVCLNQKSNIKEWQSMSFDEYNTLIHFKPIKSVLSTFVRDLILRENLQTAAVFMDSSFGNQTLSIVEDLSFVRIETMINSQDYSIDAWKLKLNSLRRMKIENYFVLADTFTINKFLEAFNQQSMFAKHIRVYVLTLNTAGKIKCISCKHATFHIVRPIISKLHDYESSERLFNLDSLEIKNRIQLYFYYDLFRLIMTSIDQYLKLIKEINSKNELPKLEKEQCETFFKSSNHLDESPIGLPLNDFDFLNNPSENDPATFNFRQLLAQQIDYVYGLYGDFKLRTDSLEYGYQDIAMRIEQETYLKQRITRESYAEWSFDTKEGNIYFSAHLLEGDEESGEASKEEGKSEEPKEEPKAEPKEESKAEPKEEPKAEKSEEAKEEKSGGGGDSEGESGGDAKEGGGGEDGAGAESGGSGKPKDTRITIFIVEHPPFMMKRIIDKSKEVATTTTSTTTTTTASSKEDGEKEEEPEEEPEEEEKKTEYEYYGFLIDLFELIKEELRIQKTPFPDYKFEEIEISKGKLMILTNFLKAEN